MRFLLACLVACLFVVTTTADRLVCPDGCADETESAASQYQPSPCAFCHAWNDSPAVVASRPVPRVIARVPPVATDPAATAIPPLEHPPKAA